MSQLNTYCGRGTISFTRSQSDDLMIDGASTQNYIAATWRGSEAIIYGFGSTPWMARNCARQCDAPPDVEVCSRVIGELMVWQSPSGKRVTVEDFLTID